MCQNANESADKLANSFKIPDARFVKNSRKQEFDTSMLSLGKLSQKFTRKNAGNMMFPMFPGLLLIGHEWCSLMEPGSKVFLDDLGACDGVRKGGHRENEKGKGGAVQLEISLHEVKKW
jgi:hypothetical protein